jgi:hypothetical protein
MAEREKLSEPIIPLTADLVFRFLSFGSVVAERRRQRLDIGSRFITFIRTGVLRLSMRTEEQRPSATGSSQLAWIKDSSPFLTTLLSD